MARKKSMVNQVPKASPVLEPPPSSFIGPAYDSAYQSYLTSVRMADAQRQADMVPPELRAFIAARARARKGGTEMPGDPGLTRGAAKRHRKSLLGGSSAQT